MKIVIVGGVAGGMSAAARARRLDEKAEIIVIERSDFVSFANCGLPYHVAGDIPTREALLLHTARSLKRTLNLDVRMNSTATAIDPAGRIVTVDGPSGVYTENYDALILSPGAEPMVPPIDGVASPGVHQLYTIPQMDGIIEQIDGGASRALVIGAGFIGLEAVEALRERGLDVTLVEFAPHVLPPLVDELAPILQEELEEHGVRVITGAGVSAVQPDDDGLTITLSNGEIFATDLVILSTGVRPRSDLARDAGLELGERGAIVVDSRMRTSDPHIWAVGDAVQVRQSVGGVSVLGPVPLAAPANRHGRLAADSIVRGIDAADTAPPAVLGTAIVRVFGQVAAVTGASPRMLDSLGIEHFTVSIHPNSHASYYPGAEPVHMVASFTPDGTIVGAAAVGRDGVDKRIDVLATAIKASMTADDLADLDLAYAPPFGSAKDAVNMLAFTAQNILDGTMPVWRATDLDEAMKSGLILDVRSASEFATGMVRGSYNIPHTRLRERIDEVREAAAGRPIFVHCASGVRSYLATRVLVGNGLDARNLLGGEITLRRARPDAFIA